VNQQKLAGPEVTAHDSLFNHAGERMFDSTTASGSDKVETEEHHHDAGAQAETDHESETKVSGPEKDFSAPKPKGVILNGIIATCSPGM